MTHLDLFSGIGGFSLAAEWAGFKTIGFVERDKYCQKVLKKHWPDVPIVEDIRDVEGIKGIVENATSIRGGSFSRNTVHETGRASKGRREGLSQDSEGQDGSTIADLEPADSYGQSQRRGTVEPVTLITGGFPCQSFSVAGKRRGTEDDRYLWPEMLAVIKAIKPTWVLAENVAGIIPMALDTVLSDLVQSGYTPKALDIPACAIGAKHRRCRIWIVAHSNGVRFDLQRLIGQGIHGQEQTCNEADSGSQDVADTNTERPQGYRGLRECRGEWLAWQGSQALKGIWESEPNVGRVAHGIPHRVDRLRCLGNAIVPQVAYEILRGIAVMELSC